MQRRCTEHSCRRVFLIGPTAPVTCPYCGRVYPRVQPDPQAPRISFGYTVRADFTQVRDQAVSIFYRVLSQRISFRHTLDQPVAVGNQMTYRDARDLCIRLQRQGVRADVITVRQGQQEHLFFFRPPGRTR